MKQFLSAVLAVIIVMLFLGILNASLIPKAHGGELSREQSMYLYAIAYGELGHIPAPLRPSVLFRVSNCAALPEKRACATSKG